MDGGDEEEEEANVCVLLGCRGESQKVQVRM